jgi:glycosyltransferase involved in cell wall biosynthesis
VKRRIRVLYLIGTLELGGAERQLTELALGLDRNRFEPSVFCLFGGGPLVRPLEDHGIPVRNMGIQGTRLRRHPWKVAGHVARVIGAVRAVQPDVLHGYLYWAYVAAAFAGRLAGVPVIVAGRRSLGDFKAGKKTWLAIERLANWLTTQLIANSQAVKTDVLRQERVPAHKVAVIYNGIELSRYATEADPSLRERLGVSARSLVVTVIANLIHYKGHRYFLSAWRKVVEAVPNSIALLAGDGPLRVELETQASDLGIENSVIFLGRRMDVPEILAVTDILVHPSLEEGFCNAILEAMAAGKAVVATAVGGNPEAVVDGETGILVPPKDPESLAQAVLALMKEPERARKMGLAGRARVGKEFGLQTMVERYEQVYLDLLKRRKVRLDPR